MGYFVPILIAFCTFNAITVHECYKRVNKMYMNYQAVEKRFNTQKFNANVKELANVIDGRTLGH